MIQSDQIINENSYPPIKNESFDSRGKVRILSFDIDFSDQAAVAQEDLILVRIPKTQSKILQIGLSCSEATVESKFNLYISLMQYSYITESYNHINESELFNNINTSETGSFVLNINKVVDVPLDVAIDNYIILRCSHELSTNNILNGYVLYISD